MPDSTEEARPVEIIKLVGEGGDTLEAELTRPKAGNGPGILLATGERGISPTNRAFAAYLAEDGYVVLAIDGKAGLEGLRPALLALAPHLNDQQKIGGVGFGIGGRLVLRGAAECGLEAAVAYWPIMDDALPAELAGLSAPVMIHTVSDLPDTIAAIGPDTRIFTYPECQQGFVFPGEPAYDKWAARVAYSRTLAPLRRTLGPHYDLAALFREHLRHEFDTKDADATMETMIDTPYVNHVPTRTGGVGHDLLKRFYKYHFIPEQPEDRNFTLLSETVGSDTVILEMVTRFTHNNEVEHMLPGIAPTGKEVEIPILVLAKFRGDKLYHEHIYWDQASLLTQIGALDPRDLPISGVEEAHKLLDETLPSNELMKKWAESEGKPI